MSPARVRPHPDLVSHRPRVAEVPANRGRHAPDRRRYQAPDRRTGAALRAHVAREGLREGRCHRDWCFGLPGGNRGAARPHQQHRSDGEERKEQEQHVRATPSSRRGQHSHVAARRAQEVRADHLRLSTPSSNEVVPEHLSWTSASKDAGSAYAPAPQPAWLRRHRDRHAGATLTDRDAPLRRNPSARWSAVASLHRGWCPANSTAKQRSSESCCPNEATPCPPCSWP